MVKRAVLLTLVSLSVCASEDPVQSLTPEELENYQFQHAAEPNAVTVRELKVGQRAILDGQRRDIKNLLYRHTGKQSLAGNSRDLAVIQALIEKEVLGRSQVREWQAVGVVFGDVLAGEFGLTWVSYEDDLGVSKALRWRDTENYVFPVTLFSKRIEFNEEPNVYAIFEKLKREITRFKELPAPVAGASHNR